MSSASSGSDQKEEPKKPPTPEKAPERDKGAVQDDNAKAAGALERAAKKQEAPATEKPTTTPPATNNKPHEGAATPETKPTTPPPPAKPEAPKTEQPAGDTPSPSTGSHTQNPKAERPKDGKGQEKPSYAKKTSDAERGKQFNDTVTRLGQQDPAIQKANEKYEAEKKAYDSASKEYQSSNAFLEAFRRDNASDTLYQSQQSLDKSRADLFATAAKNPNISPEDMRALRGASFSENSALHARNADAAAQLSDTYRTYENSARLARNTAGAVALGTAAVMTGGLALEGAALATGGTLTTAGTLGAYVGGAAAAGTTGALAGYGYELFRGSGEIAGTAAITGKFSETTEKLAPIAEAKARESAETGAKIGAAIGAVGPLSSTITTGIGVGLASYGAAQGVDTIKQNVGRSQELSREAGKAFIHGDDASAARLREEASIANLQAALGGVDIAASVGVGGAILKKITTPRQTISTPIDTSLGHTATPEATAPHTPENTTAVHENISTPPITVNMGDGQHVTPMDTSPGHTAIPEATAPHTSENIPKVQENIATNRPPITVKTSDGRTVDLTYSPTLNLYEGSPSKKGIPATHETPAPGVKNPEQVRQPDAPIRPHIEQTEKQGVEPPLQLSEKSEQGLRPSPLRQNRQPREIWDVPRDNVIHQIGDTNGSYEGFLANMNAKDMLFRGNSLINGEGNWIGGNRKLIMMGDILGDRNMGGLQTYEHIARLRAQGADIHVLAGNHEDLVIGHLTDGKHVGYSAAKLASLDDQGRGLLEFARFVDPNMSNFDAIPSGDAILSAMRKDPRGRTILEQMTQLKLGVHADDTLNVHTDPNHKMIAAILRDKNGIDGLNAIFQKNLKARLLDGADPATLDPEFYALRNDFLSVENGRAGHERTGKNIVPMSEADGIALRNAGINRINHGHTDHKKLSTIYIGGVEITSIDNSSFKGGFDNERLSAFTIDLQGNHLKGLTGTEHLLQSSEITDGRYEDRGIDWNITRGTLKNRQKEGVETITSEKGVKLGYTTYQAGVRRGDSESRYYDGTLKAKGNYENDLKQGKWVRRTYNGDYYTSNYDKGLLQGTSIKRSPNGAYMGTDTFRNNTPDGPHERVSENGDIISKGIYNAGNRQGQWITTDSKGIRGMGEYNNDIKIGKWVYTDKNGNTFTESYSPDGELIYQ